VQRLSEHRTVADNQQSVKFQIYEGDSAVAEENNFLGHFHITNLRKAKAGEVQFDSAFDIDQNGILVIRAMERGT
jgi:molecular chaperone DnaK (HSP70)